MSSNHLQLHTPFHQNDHLIGAYAAQLRNNTIETHELEELLSHKFKPTPDYKPSDIVNQDNHSEQDEIIDFVHSICEQMTEEQLYALCLKMISYIINKEKKAREAQRSPHSKTINN